MTDFVSDPYDEFCAMAPFSDDLDWSYDSKTGHIKIKQGDEEFSHHLKSWHQMAVYNERYWPLLWSLFYSIRYNAEDMAQSAFDAILALVEEEDRGILGN